VKVGGRKKGTPNKATADIKALARVHGPEAVEKLVELMRTGPEKVRLAAARELLDRGYGKPTQAVEVSGHEGGPLLDWTALLAKPPTQE
jgi:hypothetical protein